MPLRNIWVPRRDSRGLFVPKRPHTSLAGGNMSTTAQWANWIYPVPTRGIYASAVDEIGVLGNYGGTADRTPTPYGLGINTPNGWEWGRSGVLTPGGFNQTRQTLFSVFYLYDATKLTTTNRYINLGVGRSRDVASVNSIDETGLFWSNQAGEQAIYATTATVSFGGTNASVTGVGNGLHCIVATYTVNGNLELYLDGSLVSTGVTGTYAVAWTNLPNFFFGGLGPADQNVGTILFAGTVYGQIFSAAEVQAFTANPFGYFFVDAPNRRRLLLSGVISDVIVRPSSDVTTTGWTAYPDPPLYAKIDEAIPDDADYITSPDLNSTPGPAIFGISASLPAGSYDVRFRARRTASSGQARVSLLDSSNVVQGTSGWVTLTGSFAQYTAPVTTTGTAVRVRIEVQP